jgi:fatty acid desaturase
MLPNLPDLPNAHKPWAKTVARIVICVTLVALAVLAYFLETHNSLHIPEVVGIFLLFLTIVPPNLAIIYPWLLPSKHVSAHGPDAKSTVR